MEEKAAITPTEGPTAGIDRPQQLELLRLARAAVEEAIGAARGSIIEPDDNSLLQPASVFVTLWQERGDAVEGEALRELRGCIGRLEADLPLYEAVRTAAMGAAVRDPRFPPLRADELDRLVIEIAILTEPVIVESLDEVVVGRDGLMIEQGGRRGLLLPKVASRLHWDRGAFLRAVCLKAGLPEDTWPERGTLYRFQTTVFQE